MNTRELSQVQQLGVDFGKYIGGGLLFVIYLLVFYVYLSLTGKFLINKKIKMFLDFIVGVGLPFLGFGLLMLLENILENVFQVSGLVNDPHGYIILVTTSALLGIFSLLKKRKTLGLSLIITVIVSVVITMVVLQGIQNAH